jgi:hypothetical protein
MPNEFVAEQMKGLAEMVGNMRKSQVEAARRAARDSATRIRSLNQRIRELARSGVRVTEVSQGAAQSLIELQEDIVNTALTEAAQRIERLAYTESVRDLAAAQAEVLQAARQRIVQDIARAVTILKVAGGEVRGIATRTGGAVTRKTTAARRKAPAKKKARRTTTRKAPARKAKAARKKVQKAPARKAKAAGKKVKKTAARKKATRTVRKTAARRRTARR